MLVGGDLSLGGRWEDERQAVSSVFVWFVLAAVEPFVAKARRRFSKRAPAAGSGA